MGADPTSGVSFPSLRKIAWAYGIKYFKVAKSNKLADVIEEVMNYPKAVICEVMCLRDQQIVPTVSAYTKEDGSLVSKPIEDMHPFLDREEFIKEMLVKPLPE